jgi:hypothetical protein
MFSARRDRPRPDDRPDRPQRLGQDLDPDRSRGTAHVSCLASHPDIERLKPMLRTGEIWSVVGEDWTTKAP